MSLPGLPWPARHALHRGQSNGRLWLAIGISLKALSFAYATLAAGVLPQGGTYVAGTGAIASQGNGLVITQPGSTRGVIVWNSFSIGRTNSVTFDNGSGATLSRVTGGAPSAILGRLGATGSLYVINPQGIVVGPSGVIGTGGRFVASTLDVRDCAFMQGGGSLTLSGHADASVINLGRISSRGGDVFMIARGAVVNAGSVAAPNGTAELAAGAQVLLQDSASSRQVFVQTGSQRTVVDTGRIRAAQVSLQAADGNVYALAGGGARIRATGTSSRDGHVWLVADSGSVEQLGEIAARNADGSGGMVDTQAAQLAFGRHAAVHAGQWNLSTPTFTIDDAAARALQRSLNAGTSVNVRTTGANGATGDLGVASSLRWQGPASLTLDAFRDVSVASGTTIANNGAGSLVLRADASAIDDGGSVINNGTMDWSHSTGVVSAYFDMNGVNSSGVVMQNPMLSPSADGGPVSQYTAYKLVNSLTDLNSVNADLAGNYALGTDVNAAPPPGTFNMPIGGFLANATSFTYFTGQFDGLGHTISGLSINASAADPSPPGGLFSAIGATGVVRNLNVQGTIAGPPSLGNFGMLAGINDGIVASDHSSGTIDLPGAGIDLHAGGLVGDSTGLIYRSSSSTDVSTFEGYAGGLVGADEGAIRQSFASGNVAAYGIGAGGLVGLAKGLIFESYATGAVMSQQGSVGGLVYLTLFSDIEQSFATGHLQAPYGRGGIAAQILEPGDLQSDTVWDTQTTGTNIAVVSGPNGGTVGTAQGLTTAQMSTPSSFSAAYDFGPNGVWAMPAGATHPILRWQLAP